MPKIKRVNLSEQLTSTMIEFIENGTWEEGRKLPNEIELSESFHVSRNIMREALKVLNSMNILDSHTGKGTFVSAGAKDNIFRMRFFEELVSDSATEYAMESRLAVEPELAAMACRRCSDEDIRKLREEVEESVATATNNTKKNFSFHTRLADLSGNPLLANFIRSIICTLEKSTYSSFAEKATDIDLSSLQDHLRIVEAMEMRDAELAKYIMYCHLKKRIDVIKNAPRSTDVNAG